MKLIQTTIGVILLFILFILVFSIVSNLAYRIEGVKFPETGGGVNYD